MKITQITQHCFSSLLEVHFSDGVKKLIAFEILRIHSPKASTKMTTQSVPPLVVDKAFVKIVSLNFDENTMSIIFDDNHASGNYSATYLRLLCQQQDTLWRDYLARVRYAKQLKENAICLPISG
jgi:DUF971 family protein